MQQQPEPKPTPDQPAAPQPPERRTFLQWLTYGLCGAAAAVLGVPVVGYFLGVRKQKVHWVNLGPVSRYQDHVNETRLATFENPLSEPWDGITAQTGAFVRYLGKDNRRQDQFLV